MHSPRRLLQMVVPAFCSTLPISATVAGQRPQPPVIIAFSINEGAESVVRAAPLVRLVHEVAGTPPAEYRVSARADFAGALWQPYSLPLRLTGWTAMVRPGERCEGRLAGHRLVLFLQVRAEIGGVVRIVNGQRTVVPQKVESNVVSDTICAAD